MSFRECRLEKNAVLWEYYERFNYIISSSSTVILFTNELKSNIDHNFESIKGKVTFITKTWKLFTWDDESKIM